MTTITNNITNGYQFRHFKTSAEIEIGIGQKLLNEEMAGIVIENFLTPAEIALLINGFYGLNRDELIKINEGFISYPISFAQYTQALQNSTTTEEEFHKYAKEIRNYFPARFGVDLESKLITLFEKVFTGKQVAVPVDKNNYGSFLPYNFRELLPKYGELKIHCENLFFNEFPLFFKLMSHSVLRKNDFSFFVVLQKPEQGGELCLYDKKWDDTDKTEFTEIGDTNNFVLRLTEENINAQLINPTAGSIVLFSGGDIWHKIETVQGSRSRITVGGFVSSGVDGNKMFMWA